MQAHSKSCPGRCLRQAQYEMLAELRNHVRQYTHFSEFATQVAGLSPRQYQALLVIKGFTNREEITIGQFAEQLQIAYRSATVLVNRLVEQNLIVRNQSVEDSRQVYVALSERGAEILEQLVRTHQREVRRLAPSLQRVLRD